jgi:hypothetical protein
MSNFEFPMIPATFQPVPNPGGRGDFEVLRDDYLLKRPEMRRTDSEGMIPVTEEHIPIYVVDCPSLHLVGGAALSPPRYLGVGDVCISLVWLAF